VSPAEAEAEAAAMGRTARRVTGVSVGAAGLTGMGSQVRSSAQLGTT
jgi:hypothetical protein